jgi:hypothetical protein
MAISAHAPRPTTASKGARAANDLSLKGIRNCIWAVFPKVDGLIEHDPEKCAAVFRKDHAQSKN